MQTFETTLEEKRDATSNFRVFEGMDENDQPIYIDSHKTNEASLSSTVYVLVSIMNALFTFGPSVLHMMKETEARYGDTGLSITYLCADTLQNITKSCLFNIETGQDPVEKFRKKWKNKYDESLTVLQTEHPKVNHTILYWSNLEETPTYQAFKSFTEAVIHPDLTLTRLENVFPHVKKEILQALLQHPKVQKILTNVPLIAHNFSSKTYKKLKKAAKKESQKGTALSLELKKLGVATTTDCPEKTALDEREKNLEIATFSYFAAECAGLLALPFLAENSITLDYPISSSQGADLIFSTYKIVEALCQEFNEPFSLPAITQPLIFVDSLVPDNLRYSNKQQKHNIKETSSSDGSHSNSDDEKHYKKDTSAESKNARNNNLTMTIDSALPSLSSNASSFGFASTTKNLLAYNVTEKIIQKIDIDIDSGIKGRQSTYKNGVICEIKITDIPQKVDYSLEKVRNIITSAVINVTKPDNNDEGDEEKETIIFDYKGHSIELTIRPTNKIPANDTSSLTGYVKNI